MIGTRLGPYEVTAKLGEGGMGEVWRATDTKLRRDVAIKVLPAAFVEDKERLARFEREAQLLAQLHHPNIASIFAMERWEGREQEGREAGRGQLPISGEASPASDAAWKSEAVPSVGVSTGRSSVVALVMELVEGPTLAERLDSGALPLDESLLLARQIAEALEGAHEKGIIHRDLKPQNIKASSEGKIKVLDFGLAKAMDPTGTASGDPGSASKLAHSPTLTMGATVQGMILGTAAYMAPEQAKGLPTDKRADIWAFGVVLYEMLVGGSLFAGDTVGDTLAAVIRADIDLDRLPPATPAALRRLLRRCLERNPKNRLHDIADARIVLDDLLAGRIQEGTPAAAPGALAAPAKRSRAQWLLLAAAAAVALAAGIAIGRGVPGDQRPSLGGLTHAELEITAPPKTTFVSGLALSNDGRRLALVVRGQDGRTRLWVRSLDSGQAQELPGTTDALYPFWDADSRRLGFFAQNKLKVIDLMGGAARSLADVGATTDARGGTWNTDDRIVYAPTFLGSLFEVSAQGGEPKQTTGIAAGTGIGTQRFPRFLPDGKRFVFYASSGTGIEPGEIYLGRLGDSRVKKLGSASSMALYAAPGYLLYVQNDSLVAQRFDLDREELVGQPIPLGITLPGSVSISGQRTLAVSDTGVLVYRVDKRNATQLVWADRRGADLGTVTTDVDTWFYSPTLSPDGRRFAVAHYDAGSTSGGIWVHDLDRHLATQLTFGEKADDTLTAWSPDGQELAYASARATASGIYRIGATAPGSEQLAIGSEQFMQPYAWTAGGDLIYSSFDTSGQGTFWIRPLRPDSTPRRLSPDRANEVGADLSPDGRWLAYQSDVTRRFEVYVRRLDDHEGTSTVRVSSDGGSTPRWRRDGKELFYLDSSGRIVAVPVRSLDPIELGDPEPLFDARLEASADRQYDVTADGQRFLLNRTLITEQAPISVVLGWQERLRRAAAR